MKKKERQDRILELLQGREAPVTGSELAEYFGVTRQVIISDLNTLRAAGCDILATHSGYRLNRSTEVKRVFKVRHSRAELEEELNLIVDLGAEVRDVMIFHRTYGRISAGLNIRSRKDVQAFLADIRAGVSQPLMTATDGYHYHTVAARDAETLDLAERALRSRGFLVPLLEYEPEELDRFEF